MMAGQGDVNTLTAISNTVECRWQLEAVSLPRLERV